MEEQPTDPPGTPIPGAAPAPSGPPWAPVEISYETPLREGNAPLLVKLAGIFGLVSAGLSLIAALLQGAVGGFMFYITSNPALMAPPPGAAGPGAGGPGPTPFPRFMLFYYFFLALGALAVCAVKIIASIKLLRPGRGSWGWGLAGAICGCIELLWCSLGCVLPLGAGVYTIVILCFDHVRIYLRERSTRVSGGA